MCGVRYSIASVSCLRIERTIGSREMLQLLRYS